MFQKTKFFGVEKDQLVTKTPFLLMFVSKRLTITMFLSLSGPFPKTFSGPKNKVFRMGVNRVLATKTVFLGMEGKGRNRVCTQKEVFG